MFRPSLATLVLAVVALSTSVSRAQTATPAAPARTRPQTTPAGRVDPAVTRALANVPVDIPFTKFVLPNGLTLIVHEDTKAPIVHFNIWYHVGSKNEPRGQSGFAHLFEHLMYQGSENFNDDFFKATRQVGATNQNGSTSSDRTNYYQTVPKEAIDTVLWLESDRMGHFLPALTQARLNEQRGVVQNEKRQGQNQPYAIAQDLIIRATYPEEHPYGHSVIGSMDDLNAGSLEQVREWFRTYYGPSNAILVLSGDIKPDDAKARVEKYFGAFDPGTPVAHPKTWVVRRTGSQREVAYDRVPAPRLSKIWNVPEWGNRDLALLDVYADVLAGDRTARLNKRLVYDDALATQVSAFAGGSEIAGRFTVTVTAKSESDLARIEKIVDEEMSRLIASGPTVSELEKVRARNVSSLVEQLESTSQKASILAQSEAYLGTPDGWKRNFDVQRAATPGQIAAAARSWLSDGSYTLTILPFGYASRSKDADRTAMPLPAPGTIAAGKLPPIQRATLSNGLKVMLVERHQTPVVSAHLVVDTAYAADFAQTLPGTATLAMSLMDEGTPTRDSLTLADQLTRLGASVIPRSGEDQATVTLSTLTATLEPSLEIFADIVRNPAFRSADISRLRTQQLAGLRAQRLQPAAIANRVLSRLIFGEAHPLGRQTTEASLSAVTREQLVAFHQRWFTPDNATLIVVGDTSMADLTPKLETALGGWKASTRTPRITVPAPAARTRPALYLVDRPGSPQSYIVAGIPAAPRAVDNEMSIVSFNTNFGGNFTSRINMNLREEKGWSYGVSSQVVPGRGPRMFRITAQVQTDKTKESIVELLNELRDVMTTRPLTETEVRTSQNNSIMGLSSRWETTPAIASGLQEIVTYGLPDTYLDTYPERIRGVTPEMALAAGKALVPAPNFAWVVVGDRRRIEAGLRELGMEFHIVNADGQLEP